jgi:tellurite resistance protein TerC
VIVYTSNIFAILGLRALFFAISGLFYLFHYLVHGLALVLLFVGIKMLLTDVYHMPVYVSLGVVAALIFGSILASILFPKKGGSEFSTADNPEAAAPDPKEPSSDLK